MENGIFEFPADLDSCNADNASTIQNGRNDYIPQWPLVESNSDDLDVPHPELRPLFSFVMDASIPVHKWEEEFAIYYGPYALENKRPTNPVFELYTSIEYNGAFQIDLIKSAINPKGIHVSWNSILSLDPDDFKIYGDSSPTPSALQSCEIAYLERINNAINSEKSGHCKPFKSVEQIIWTKRMIEVVADTYIREKLIIKGGKTLSDLFLALNIKTD